jgi:subtilisin family serine protease
VISVGNLDEAAERVHVTSSQGPARDGRSKPEVAAPGTDIVAARGVDGDDPWVSMTGTSVASPFVAGVVGLMLATQPKLTAAQISGILKRTARPLPGGDFVWRSDAGYGRIDPEECLKEAALLNERRSL